MIKSFALIFLGVIFAITIPLRVKAANNAFLDRSSLLEVVAQNITNNQKNNEVRYSDQIIISEIMPKPKEGTDFEYIEIYNQGQETVNLSGWMFKDIMGKNTSRFTIDHQLLIQSGEYKIFYHSETKIALNDDGDGVELLSPDGELRFATEKYSTAEQGKSFSYIGNLWLWSLLTPGAVNMAPLSDNAIVESNPHTIAETKQSDDGTKVSTSGKVTAIPGQLSDQYFYIQDDVAGIQIYSYKKLFPRLNFGDWIRVTGELSEIAGERRIKIDRPEDIEVIAHGIAMSLQDLKMNQLGNDSVGKYVKVKANLVKSEGDTFYVQDESGKTMKVMIKKGTGIKKPRMKKGSLVEVSGILSQYKGEYRILPFRQDDVKVITSGDLPKAGSSEMISILCGSIIYFLCVLLLKMRKKPSIWAGSWPRN